MKILVTGASGFLGWNLCSRFGQENEIVGTVHSHSVDIPGVRVVKADLTEREVCDKLLYENFDAVIHLAAQANLNICEQQPELSRKINVDASVELAREAYKRGIKFVFTSTDIVFDGTSAPYHETDHPNPINEYGRQKTEAEQKILSVHPTACICRMPLMFGPVCPVKPSFLQPMLEAMRAGNEVKLFVDEYRTLLGAESACDGLMLAAQKGSGIWHLGGPQRISRYEFGMLAAKVFEIPNANIIKSKQSDVQLAAARPADVSLENTNSKQAGFTPKSLKEEFLKIKEFI